MTILEEEFKVINEENRYILTKKELKNAGSFQFKDGDIVICNKYYIHIKYGDYNRPSLLTTVNTRDDIRDLPMSKQPYYIRDFIERTEDDLIA